MGGKTEDSREVFFHEAVGEFRKLKELADRALAQSGDEAFFAALDGEANSIALLVKHLAGNMRSRWSDFLTTDGEKPDRHRDREFEREPADTRAWLTARWEEGWRMLFAALAALGPADVERAVMIRAEPHTVMQAVNRSLAHYAYHVGQIVLLAKHARADSWQSLSVPRGKTEEYNARMFGRRP